MLYYNITKGTTADHRGRPIEFRGRGGGDPGVDNGRNLWCNGSTLGKYQKEMEIPGGIGSNPFRNLRHQNSCSAVCKRGTPIGLEF